MVDPTNSNKNVENQNLWRNYSDLTSPEIKSSVGKLALGFIKFISYFTIIIPACIYFSNKVISKKEINPIDPQIVNNCLTSANPTNSSPSLEGRVTGPPPLDAEKVNSALNSATSPIGADQSDQIEASQSDQIEETHKPKDPDIKHEINDTVKPSNEDTTKVADQTTNETGPVTDKPVDQEASTVYELLNNHYTTIIIDLNTYHNKDKAIKEIKVLRNNAQFNTTFGFGDKSYLLDNDHQTFIAVDNKDNIVGFLFGKLREDEFYVELLVVDEKFNSKKGKSSKEKIGTRLMFQAMQKIKELGKKKLYLEYETKSAVVNTYSNLYKEDTAGCERRTAFYDRFQYFKGITYTYTIFRNRLNKATFDIENFDLRESIKKLNATALGILGTRAH